MIDEPDTRTRLLDAAASCIAEVGWGNVRTRQISARAGVNMAMVNYHFGGKDNLLIEAAVQATRRELARAETAVASAPGLSEALDAVVAVLGPMADASTDASLLVEITLNASRDPKLAEAVDGMLDSFRVALTSLVRASQEAGRLPAKQDPEATAIVVAALLDGLLLHRALDRNLDLERVRKALGAGLVLSQAETSASDGRQTTAKKRRTRR